MSTFANQVVWITGASSGIGEELTYLFNAEGAKLVLSARRKDALERVAEKCKDAFVLPLDLAHLGHPDALVQQVINKFGRIDVLINNGGNSQRSTADETPMTVVRDIMEVNFFGTVALTKAVLPVMKSQKSGHIAVVSSIAGKFGFYLRSSYSAAKHALYGFFDSLRLEEENNGILVTMVSPGRIQTNVSINAVTKDGSAHGVMDRAQGEGMPADVCAKQIVRAMKAQKEDVLIGGKEILAVRIKRLLPGLFGKIIRKQKPDYKF